MNLVVDSSVIIKWFVKQDEQDRAQALWLKNQFLKGQLSLVVPDLVFYEISNVLKTKKEFRRELVRKAIRLLFLYPFQTIWPSSALFLTASKIAYSHELTIYDAVYLALAQELGCPFLTADQKLQVKRKNLLVYSLKDFKIESI
ncbi:MAG TPA: type II toxin-antitoxin system VapC family toxin [Patescibacteria group bacterium]|nr:type II toxin-antitoxin system VapC family toxin [Patescibacteria group bacterium]